MFYGGVRAHDNANRQVSWERWWKARFQTCLIVWHLAHCLHILERRRRRRRRRVRRRRRRCRRRRRRCCSCCCENKIKWVRRIVKSANYCELYFQSQKMKKLTDVRNANFTRLPGLSLRQEMIGRLRERAKRDESDFGDGSGNVSGAGLDLTGSGHSSKAFDSHVWLSQIWYENALLASCPFITNTRRPNTISTTFRLKASSGREGLVLFKKTLQTSDGDVDLAK